MSHRPYYARKPRRWPFWLLAIAAVCGIWKYCTTFNPQKLVENSELKQKTFSARVVEIVAPKSGIKAYLMTEKSNPIVSMSFIFADSGSAYDEQNLTGLSDITSMMLLEGAGKLSRRQFKETLENYAIDLNYSADKDDFEGKMLSTKENLPKAAELLRLSLTEPTLDQENLDRLQQQILQSVNRLLEKPEARLANAVGKIIFGKHPYGIGAEELRKFVKNIKTDDIRSFIKNRLAKDRIYIGIAGDISENEAENLIDNVFGNLPEQSQTKALPAEDIKYAALGQTIIEDNTPQVLFEAVAPSVPRLSKDFYPLYIANYILGGAGLNSRLNQAAREKEGLTYGVYTGMELLKHAPQLVGSFSTTPQNFPRMEEIFINEWTNMGNKGITAKELQSAKNYLQSSYNLRFADIGTLSAILASMQREKLGIDFLQKRNGYIEEITLERVNRVVKKYFSPDNLAIVSLGQIEQKGN